MSSSFTPSYSDKSATHVMCEFASTLLGCGSIGRCCTMGMGNYTSSLVGTSTVVSTIDSRCPCLLIGCRSASVWTASSVQSLSSVSSSLNFGTVYLSFSDTRRRVTGTLTVVAKIYIPSTSHLAQLNVLSGAKLKASRSSWHFIVFACTRRAGRDSSSDTQGDHPRYRRQMWRKCTVDEDAGSERAR